MRPALERNMSKPHVRPRLELELDDSPETVMQRLRDRLVECPFCTGTSVGNHAELFVPPTEERLWSPWLSVTAEQREEGGARVRGRFGPHPTVWTLYMFLSFALGFALLVGTTWGYAQWAMDTTPWALYSIPLLGALGGLLFAISLIGQRLGADQMTSLRKTLEELVAPDTKNNVQRFTFPPCPECNG
jgi:hypothetical protein